MIVIDDLEALFSYGANRGAAPEASEHSGINQLEVMGQGCGCCRRQAWEQGNNSLPGEGRAGLWGVCERKKGPAPIKEPSKCLMLYLNY